MSRSLIAALALVALSACGDGQPFDFGNPVDPEPPATGTDIPEELANNLFDITYNAAGAGGQGTLLVDIRSLDASQFDGPYDRVRSRDIAGYRAFQYRDDTNGNGRLFLAFVAESPTGNVTAAAVADGGQFNRYFGGGFYSREGSYDQPNVGPGTTDQGIVRYAGSYAGIITLDTSGAVDYDDPEAPRPSPIYPYEPSAVSGQVLIIADFTNDSVNGVIYNRQIISADGVTVLPEELDLVDLALTSTEIDENGEFLGVVEQLGVPDEALGDFGGIFAGTDASDIAGVIMINPYPNDSNTWEHGMFVLPTCSNSTCPAP